MNNFIQALDMSIKTKNWYSVLFISLTLPDICGKIDEPNKGSKARTIHWYNKYLKQAYTRKIGVDREEHVFLSGADFYALRCAYLHEGSGDITSQCAREVLRDFVFIQKTSGPGQFHCNTFNSTLLLYVEQFGKDVLAAVNAWLTDIKEDPEKISKIDGLLEINMMAPGEGFVMRLNYD